MRFLISRFLIAASVCSAAPAIAEDWYQFRGPSGNGTSTGVSLPTNWGPDSNIKWKASIPGEGWSAPVIVSGRVIVTTAVSDGGKDPDSVHQWQVICLDEKTGESLWTKTAKVAKPTIQTHRDNTYASETPVSDGQRVLAYFGMTGLFCYDLDGNEIWSKDLGSYVMRNDWGTSSSPVIKDGLVFIQVDNEESSFIVALDMKTGEERWRKAREESSNWGSPIIWKNRVRTELITSGNVIRSYDPANGEILWELEFGRSGINSTPAGDEDLLMVGHVGRNGGGMFAVRAGASGDISLNLGEKSNDFVAWTSDEGPGRSSPVVTSEFVYLLGGRGGMVTCMNAQTGEVVFKERVPGAGAFWASPWIHDGKVFCTDENGKTFVLQPGNQLNVVATNDLPVGQNDRYWATAALANGAVFVRSTSALYAITAE
jgi:outer membrane protein assembly factor BamB